MADIEFIGGSMMEDPDTNKIVRSWLSEVPAQFKQGAGLKDDIAAFVHDYIRYRFHGVYTYDNLCTAMGSYIAASSKYDSHYPDSHGHRITVRPFDRRRAGAVTIGGPNVPVVVDAPRKLTAEDCAMFWDLGIRVDDDMVNPK